MPICFRDTRNTSAPRVTVRHRACLVRSFFHHRHGLPEWLLPGALDTAAHPAAAAGVAWPRSALRSTRTCMAPALKSAPPPSRFCRELAHAPVMGRLSGRTYSATRTARTPGPRGALNDGVVGTFVVVERHAPHSEALCCRNHFFIAVHRDVTELEIDRSNCSSSGRNARLYASSAKMEHAVSTAAGTPRKTSVTNGM